MPVRSYTVGTVRSVQLRVHLSLVALPLVVVFLANPVRLSGYLTLVDRAVPASLATGLPPQRALVAGVLTTAVLFGSVTLHEFGHAALAAREGVGVEAVTLWIFGGFVTVAATTTRWDSELRIAAAGPAVNAILTGAGSLVLLLWTLSPALTFLVSWIVTVNLLLAGLNLLPVTPLDGGRMLRAVLARTRPYTAADRLATRIGWVVLAVGLLAIFAPLVVLV
ncbi:MAG: site-2 protease family protein [Halovenus sp.]